MAQTQIVATISDIGFNHQGQLMAKVTISFRRFGMEKKRDHTSGYVNLTEWIKND